MCGESNPAPATAGPGNGTLWSCKFCGVECGLAATGLAFSGHVRVHGEGLQYPACRDMTLSAIVQHPAAAGCGLMRGCGCS